MKNNQSFPIGARVRCTFDWDEQGTVIEDPIKDRVKIKWDNFDLGTNDAFLIDLRLVDARADVEDAKELQDKIDQTTSLFEQAFKALDHIKNDNDGLRAAFEDAGLVDMDNLYKVFDDAGWSSSSINC